MPNGRAGSAVLSGLLPRVNGKRRRPVRAPERSQVAKRVSWITGQIPRTDEEEILHRALTREGLETFDAVKAHLADTLYWRDLLRGGWATDIGLLRSLYAREAQDIIAKLIGVRLLIEDAN